MAVCRYFQTNSCRYGDRCRYEHVLERPTQYGYDYRQKSGTSIMQRTSSSSETGGYRQDYYRYDDRGRQYKESYDTGADRHRTYQNPSYQNRYNRYEGEGNNYQQNRFNQPPSNQNRFDQERPSNRQDTFGQSRSKNYNQVAFSQSSLKQDGHHKQVKDMLDLISKEITQIEREHMWPLTCLGITKGWANLPGLVDYSPEELRMEAYKGLKEGNFELTYARQVKALLENAQQIRNFYLHPTNATETEIAKFLGLSDNHQSSIPVQPKKVTFSFDNTPAFGSISQQQPENVFGNVFGNSAPQVAQQDFGAFASVQQQTCVPEMASIPEMSGTERNPMIHPKIEDLTPQELEQYRAGMFTFGFVPIIPPPDELCPK